MQTTALELNGWHVETVDTPFILSTSVVEQALALVRQANAAFVREDTAAWRLFGEPTLVGRLDFTITSFEDTALTPQMNGTMSAEGVVRPYEWEERPGGIGVTGKLNPRFVDLFGEVRRDWPKLHVVIEEGRRGNDDHLWADVTVGSEDIPTGGLLLVRAEPERIEYHHLSGRSISTLRTKGDKSYGACLRWWREIRTLDELPTGTTLVLKPRQGSKTHGLLMCPARSLERQKGMITRAKLEREFEGQVATRGGMYLQPWHPPMELEGHNLILRVFFARGASSPEWRCLGGVWNARRSAVVHGASDTIFGPAIIG